MNKKAIIYLVLIFATMFGSANMSHASYGDPHPIYYGQSAFYQYPDGSIIAYHYNEQTIRDLAGLYQAMGIKQVNMIPAGKPGAIPMHLRGYAHQEFARRGIIVYDPSYTPPNHQKSKKSKKQKPRPEDIFFEIIWRMQ